MRRSELMTEETERGFAEFETNLGAFFGGRSLTDEIVNQEHPNVGAAFIEAFSYIGASFLIVWSL